MSLMRGALAKWSEGSPKDQNSLLLRYFQSSSFDAWVALQYLYQNLQPGVHDYLCNRLHELGEESVEKYLLQLVYLAVSKPGGTLERTIVDLCSKSFRVAIKTQWLLVALCQDHPKSKALESFKERAYKAALEGNWEVPIRNPKLDPLSPFASHVASPPFSPPFSPGSSLIINNLPVGMGDQITPVAPALHPQHLFATQPPGRMVMSPPNHGLGIPNGLGAGGGAPGVLAQIAEANDGSVLLPTRRSGGSGLAIDLGCLLPPEQRGLSMGAGAGSAAAVVAAGGGGCMAVPPMDVPLVSAPPPITQQRANGFGQNVQLPAKPVQAPSDGGSVASDKPGPSGRVSAFGVAAANAVSAAASSFAERIQSLRRELGDGEGVTGLLERSKQTGPGGMVVAAVEEGDAGLLSDDEFGNRPMSPLTRLRYDTFGATLDFVDALCDASSALTSFSQEERHKALRWGLEHINREIEAANRRDVAIWFPMGKGGDRVLRLTTREAVLLNSREKAPFMLFVEVLEGQHESGEAPLPQCNGLDCGAAAAASAVHSSSCVGGGGDLSAAGAGAPPSAPAPVLEFGRRETYGIALTGIGAQHQHHYMHLHSTSATVSPGLSPVPPPSLAPAAAAGQGSGAVAAAAAGGGAPAKEAGQEGQEGGSSQFCSGTGSPASGPAPHALHAPHGTPAAPAGATQAVSRDVAAVAASAAAAGPGSARSPGLASPRPKYAASAAFVGALEESAANLARTSGPPSASSSPSPRSSAAAAGALQAYPAPSQTGATGGAYAAPHPQLAPAVVIPTRSASSTNIAAAALAATMAVAASSSGPNSLALQDAISARGSDGGVASSGPSITALSMTPPRGPSFTSGGTGLPPRPAAAAAPVLPVGGMSPVNAAREVSPLTSGVGASMLSASSLLRRVLGDRAADDGAAGGDKAAASAAAGSAAAAASAPGSKDGPMSFSVVRSLCFNSGASAASADPAAASAASASAGGSAGPSGRPPVPPMGAGPLGHRGMSGGGEAEAGAGSVGPLIPLPPPAPSRPPALAAGSVLSQEELAELTASGCLSPPPNVKTDPIMATKLTALLASLRGEAPMVRVRIRVLAQPQTCPGHAPGPAGTAQPGHSLSQPNPSQAGAGGALGTPADGTHPAGHRNAAGGPHAQAGSAPPGGVPQAANQHPHPHLQPPPDASVSSDAGSGAPDASGGGSAGSFSLASLASRARTGLANAGLGPGPGSAPVSDESLGVGSSGADSGLLDKSKAMALLSRLGLRRKPAAEEGDGDGASSASSSAAAASGNHAAPGPVSSGLHVATGAGAGGGGPGMWGGGRGTLYRGPRLVALSLEVAQGVNLTIPSPYRKSRRTPSHEAIEMLAGKYKIHEMPPPYECGPPLGPVGWAPMDRVPSLQERPSEEGEGLGLPSVPLPGSTGSPHTTTTVTAAEADALTVASGPEPSFSHGQGRRARLDEHGAAADADSPGAEAAGRSGGLEGGAGTEAGASAGPVPGSSAAKNLSGRLAAAGAAGGGSAVSLGGSAEAAGNPAGAASPPTPTLHRNISNAGAGAPSAARQLQLATHPPPLSVPDPAAAGPPSAVGSAFGWGSGASASATAAPTVPSPLPLPSTSPPGFAASLQSSLTRMLGRDKDKDRDRDRDRSSTDAASNSSTTPTGPSPRGGSPVRGAPGSSALAGASGGASRLARFMGRDRDAEPPALSPPPGLQQHQQQQQQQQPPYMLSAGRSFGGGAGTPPHAHPYAYPHPHPHSQPHPYPYPHPQPHPHPHTHPIPIPIPGSPSGGGAPFASSTSVRVTDGRQERESLEERRRREAAAVYGERWAAKVKRIQRESPHGRRQGWALRCVIVKSGDDCRQELLALQLVRTFGEVFRDAGLPLWVRHYEVLVTSNRTALIEMVPNTLSIHTIKSRSPPGTSLSDHFFAKWGRPGSPACVAAQRRFTESLAAYSLICYILQIKDRHNGNIMLDDDGRIVHIDFGFLLSNSPGGVNFESAPFKLTRELLEVMDSNSEGRPSEMFDYFKVLMIQGFLALRKQGDRIVLLTRMMSKSGFPCYKSGERAVKALEKRLQLPLTEVQCVAHVLQLISESIDAWRTRQYDYYQRVLNGIL
ncbi:hypothetical protein HYH03_005051 [Edaphochlamys debaryana]|uniref:1-phosphatidylinositol 4-kinase n=1 Tax=Edaphochlamys debaryana TaxID=47281 RepID=A0A836C2T6_9CHLO|nr:hypothetical protein HYH03_005051 [Edaphochlamys debaryana]|eukprot:KAG2497053.1 hypothetical protein HYH03_005051 [Edaphochlamys debaryana]